MFVTKALARLTMFAGLMALPIAIPIPVYAQQAVTLGPTDIGGTVTGTAGPEAGVWVIAETRPGDGVRAHRCHRRSGAATSCPICPTANYSVGVRGMVWWMQPSSPQSRARFFFRSRCRRMARMARKWHGSP